MSRSFSSCFPYPDASGEPPSNIANKGFCTVHLLTLTNSTPVVAVLFVAEARCLAAQLLLLPHSLKHLALCSAYGVP